jgi:hypothetical protein
MSSVPSQLFLPPGTTASVIKVGGVCYSNAGASSIAPNTSSVDPADEFSDCITCNAAPCECPSTLPATGTVMLPSLSWTNVDGSWVFTPENPGFVTWTYGCYYLGGFTGTTTLNGEPTDEGDVITIDLVDCVWTMFFGIGDAFGCTLTKTTGDDETGVYTSVSGDPTMTITVS